MELFAHFASKEALIFERDEDFEQRLAHRRSPAALVVLTWHYPNSPVLVEGAEVAIRAVGIRADVSAARLVRCRDRGASRDGRSPGDHCVSPSGGGPVSRR